MPHPPCLHRQRGFFLCIMKSHFKRCEHKSLRLDLHEESPLAIRPIPRYPLEERSGVSRTEPVRYRGRLMRKIVYCSILLLVCLVCVSCFREKQRPYADAVSEDTENTTVYPFIMTTSTIEETTTRETSTEKPTEKPTIPPTTSSAAPIVTTIFPPSTSFEWMERIYYPERSMSFLSRLMIFFSKREI